MYNKRQVLELFKSEVLPFIRNQYETDRRIDYPARREAWNNFTDSLHKDRLISNFAYNNWACPW